MYNHGAMDSFGPFVHRLNPVFINLAGIQLWYYGIIYSIGFLGVHFWLRFRRKQLNWSVEEVYDLSLLTILGVLVCGHAFEILVYEWDLYSSNPSEIWKYWHGGMSTHGVLLGGLVGTWLFSLLRKRAFLDIADEIVIPGAFFMAIGRIGNFINGENYGPVTDVWWGVQFPYAEGFRHPVDLYDSFKNIVVVSILLIIRTKSPFYRGKLLSHFLFWYGFLRILVDVFREYGSYFQGLGRGQYFNFLMAITGLFLMFVFSRMYKPAVRPEIPPAEPVSSITLGWKKVAFVILLIFSMTIPSGWSQGWLNRLKQSTQSTGAG